jgi:hypothetical protein
VSPDSSDKRIGDCDKWQSLALGMKDLTTVDERKTFLAHTRTEIFSDLNSGSSLKTEKQKACEMGMSVNCKIHGCALTRIILAV